MRCAHSRPSRRRCRTTAACDPARKPNRGARPHPRRITTGEGAVEGLCMAHSLPRDHRMGARWGVRCAGAEVTCR